MGNLGHPRINHGHGLSNCTTRNLFGGESDVQHLSSRIFRTRHSFSTCHSHETSASATTELRLYCCARQTPILVTLATSNDKTITIQRRNSSFRRSQGCRHSRPPEIQSMRVPSWVQKQSSSTTKVTPAKSNMDAFYSHRGFKMKILTRCRVLLCCSVRMTSPNFPPYLHHQYR